LSSKRKRNAKNREKKNVKEENSKNDAGCLNAGWKKETATVWKWLRRCRERGSWLSPQ
jgi:hypothetical protein